MGARHLMTRAQITPRRALVALIAVAFTLRVLGIGYGLPAEYRPDEDVVANRALNITVGHFDVEFFFWPSLYFWLVSPLFLVLMAVRHALGLGAGPSSSAMAAAAVDPTVYYLTTRLVSAVCGSLLILPIYAIGKRVAGVRAGLCAAAFAAVAFLSVRESHFGLQDAPAALAVALSLATAAKASSTTSSVGWRRNQTALGWWILAGCLAGIAGALKYHPGLVLLPIAVLAVSRGWKLALASCGAALATLVGLSPELFLRPHDVIATFLAQYQNVYSAGGVEPSLPFYLFQALPDGVGLPVLILAVAGAVLGVVKRNPLALVLTLDVVFVVVFMGHSGSDYFRYMLPTLPAMAVLAGYFVVTLSGRVRRQGWKTATIVCLSVLASVPALQSDVALDRLMTRVDTRTEMYSWAMAHIPATARVATTYFGGFFHDQALVDNYNPTGTGPARGVIDNRLGPWREILMYDTDPRAEAESISPQQADYIVVPSPYPSQLFTSPLVAPPGFHLVLRIQPVATANSAKYDVFDGFYIPIANFSGVMQPGPEILVFESDRYASQ